MIEGPAAALAEQTDPIDGTGMNRLRVAALRAARAGSRIAEPQDDLRVEVRSHGRDRKSFGGGRHPPNGPRLRSMSL
jgi:hypothetical protein